MAQEGYEIGHIPVDRWGKVDTVKLQELLNPEVILVSEDDLRVFGGEAGLWNAYPSLKQTPAGFANRVWVMPDTQLKVSSIGGGAGALALAQALSALAAELDAAPGA